jgi:hypothetical protein
MYNVTWRLKPGKAEQPIGKEVPAAMNKQAIIEVLLSYNDGNGVSVGSARGYVTKIPGQLESWLRESLEMAV